MKIMPSFMGIWLVNYRSVRDELKMSRFESVVSVLFIK